MLEIVKKKILRRGNAPSKNVPHNSLKHPEVCIEGLLLLTKHAVMTPQCGDTFYYYRARNLSHVAMSSRETDGRGYYSCLLAPLKHFSPRQLNC